mgnify:CR=1 FL=1
MTRDELAEALHGIAGDWNYDSTDLEKMMALVDEYTNTECELGPCFKHS